MPRWVIRVAGIVVVLLAFWLVARDFHAPKGMSHDSHQGHAGGPDDDGGALLYAYVSGDAGAGEGGGSPLLLADLADLATAGRSPRLDAGPGNLMPDGTPVPALPASSPRQIRFGAVLVAYAGSQPSAGGGRSSTRSRADAKALADRLFATATHDFHAAVEQGDSGSGDDFGRVKLGILEPAPEYVLFTLPVDGVGGPVDTPRGYWIVKRLE